MGSFFKHINEQDENSHGGKLYWGGGIAGGNVPFRGAYAPTLTKEELENQVSVVKDFHCDLFELSNPEHMQRYQNVMDRVVGGWYHIIYIDRKLVAEQKTAIVYIEWVQRYGELSPAARASRKQGNVYQYPTSNSQTIPLAGLQPADLGIG